MRDPSNRSSPRPRLAWITLLGALGLFLSAPRATAQVTVKLAKMHCQTRVHGEPAAPSAVKEYALLTRGEFRFAGLKPGEQVEWTLNATLEPTLVDPTAVKNNTALVTLSSRGATRWTTGYIVVKLGGQVPSGPKQEFKVTTTGTYNVVAANGQVVASGDFPGVAHFQTVVYDEPAIFGRK